MKCYVCINKGKLLVFIDRYTDLMKTTCKRQDKYGPFWMYFADCSVRFNSQRSIKLTLQDFTSYIITSCFITWLFLPTLSLLHTLLWRIGDLSLYPLSYFFLVAFSLLIDDYVQTYTWSSSDCSFSAPCLPYQAFVRHDLTEALSN